MSRPFAVEVRDALNLSLRDRRISAAFVSEQLPEWQMIWESAAKIDAEMNAAAAASQGPSSPRSIRAVRQAMVTLLGSCFDHGPLSSYDATLPARVPTAPHALLAIEGSDEELTLELSVAEFVHQLTRPGALGYDGPVCEICGAHDVCILGANAVEKGATHECGLSWNSSAYGKGLCREFAAAIKCDRTQPDAFLEISELFDEEWNACERVRDLWRQFFKLHGESADEMRVEVRDTSNFLRDEIRTHEERKAKYMAESPAEHIAESPGKISAYQLQEMFRDVILGYSF